MGQIARRHPRRHHRARRLLWRGLLVVALLLGAAYTAAMVGRDAIFVQVRTGLATPTRDGWRWDTFRVIAAADGAVFIVDNFHVSMPTRDPPHIPTIAILFWHQFDSYAGNPRTPLRRLLGPPYVGQRITLPIAPAALALAAAGCVVWRRDRRLSRIGFCLRCGYDARSLPTDDPCPECGDWRKILA